VHRADDGGFVIRSGPTSAYRNVCRKLAPREALAQCALYFVHEAFHVKQGIQHKSTVTDLRAVGSEFSLLHFDLEADCIAASAVASAMSDYSLSELKNFQITGTAAFPATARHTGSSVFRKSLRLVSLIVESEVRADAMRFDLRADQEGYAAVELSLGAGPMVVTWNGETRRVIGSVEVDGEQAGQLTNAAVENTDLAKLRALVRQLVRELTPTSNLRMV
jgi:hypothetical protein